FLEGDAIYLERILPPPNARLIVALQDTARADAPAIERASVSMQIAGGPPYAWRLPYDPQLGEPARLTVRARIETPEGLWMTTTQTVTAGSGSTPLSLRLSMVQRAPTSPTVPAAPTLSAPPAAPSPATDACASATTQADMATCAHEDFLAASEGYANRYQVLSTSMPPAQRDRLRRMQSAWLGFRTAACRYESGPVNGGSAQGFVYWNCVARMTRERADQLARLAECREGDITCSRRRP
ncbi:MAG: lysozyme inhibitor LprI family protein, partial [Caldimonas sp.]